MSRKAILSAALAAVAIAGPAASQSPASWTEVIEPFRVMGNTWFVGTAGLGMYLITTPEGHILIDAGLPETAEIVEANIEKLGFEVGDVKILLNSHAHFDHSGGLAKVKADTGARLIASEGDRYALEKGVYPGSEDVAAMGAPPVVVDEIVADGGTVSLGGVTLTAHITPGHTQGCTTWTWPVTDARGGEHTAVNFCSASVAANRLAPDPQYPGIVEDYRTTFAKVKTFDGDVFLAPHGEFFRLAEKRALINEDGDNPFVEPGAFHAFVAGQERAFEAELARQQEAVQ
jgi:metallo-beta-lactamase class B